MFIVVKSFPVNGAKVQYYFYLWIRTTVGERAENETLDFQQIQCTLMFLGLYFDYIDGLGVNFPVCFLFFALLCFDNITWMRC